jgi:lipopolysaccharide/colanic/teichoic acid biosynthesis glycosyltransferase
VNKVYFPRTGLEERQQLKSSGTGERYRVGDTTPEEIARWRVRTGVGRLLTYQWWKGVFDRLLALLAIVIASPIMVMVALGIRLDSPGGPIFRQERVGKDGRRFTACKFRTMHINNDDREYRVYLQKYIIENAPYLVDQQGQGVYKVVGDPRVTKLGAWLRKTNLDELPQLFNVLRGEMSFVGPRPEVPFALEMYSDWHRKRLSATPGITGLWQVYGRKRLSFDDMVRLDIDYIQRQSLLLDAKILLLTIRTVLTRDGS